MTEVDPGQSWRVPWVGVARKFGLQIVAREGPSGEPSAMEGMVDGFAVAIRTEVVEDEGRRTVSTTKYLVALPAAARYPFRELRPRKMKRAWGRSFKSDDPRWDRRFVVKADDKDVARVYLTSQRRLVLDGLNQRLPRGWWLLTNQGLETFTSKYASRVELVTTVETLIDCVKELDTVSMAS